MSNKLQLTKSALEAPATLAEVFELEPFRDAFAVNYLKTTGRDNGAMIFERERILFMKALQENAKLGNCERFTVYSSFVELAVSGLSLQDGQAFIIPYGKKAQFQVGWKGRLEQIQQIPAVKWVNVPVIVWQSEVEEDRFSYEYIDGAISVIKHTPKLKREEDDVIAFVYCTLETIAGVKTHLMDRETVLSIRDRYSQPYRQYIAKCKEKNVKIGDPIKMSGQNGDWYIEPPFWVTDEAQAFKKTLVKRMYSELPKTARMKALDSKIATNFDPEDATGGEQTDEISYGIVDDSPAPQQLTEATQTAPAASAEKRTRASGKTTSTINKSPQVKQMESESAPLKESMQAKGQLPADDLPPPPPGPEKNPVDDLPDLNSLNSL
jgi:phage RecT family recombinase